MDNNNFMSTRLLIQSIIRKTAESDKTDETNKELVPTVEEVFNIYSEVFECLSSLGDDTINVLLKNKDRDIEDMTPIYSAATGWVVEVLKSLVSKFCSEYLREQTHAGYLVRYKTFSPLCRGEYKTFICTCKPTAHVSRTWAFPESLSRISPLIDEIGMISKTDNLRLHPRLDIILQRMLDYGIFRYHLWSQPVDYVPIWNMKSWKNAGKPTGASSFSVKIHNLREAFKIAEKEAEWYTVNIMKQSGSESDITFKEAIGVNYNSSEMTGLNVESSLMASRTVRMMYALAKGETANVKKITEEVKLYPTDFFKIMNNLSDADQQDIDESSDITEFCHYRCVSDGRRE